MALQQALIASLLLIWTLSWDTSAASIQTEEGPDSLRGALEALDRRQRALQQRPQFVQKQHPNKYRYPLVKKGNEVDDDSVDLISDDGQPEDIGYGYQRERHEGKLSPEQLKQAMLAVLSEQDDDSDDEGEDYSEEEDKRAPPASMFRERNDQIHQHHKRASAAASAAEDRKYRRLLSALWEKYQNEEQQQRPYEDKRQDGYGGGYGYGGYGDGYDFYNSPLGWGANHFDGKRSDGYDLYNSPMGWGDGHFDGYYRKRSSDPWAFDLEARDAKRTVRKRSSNLPLHQKTDEKTQAELTQIFADGKPASATPAASSSAPAASATTTSKPSATSTTPKPQKIVEKKSIDWSEYWGLDKRRKKEAPADEEERKMMERYYRTFALATTLKRKRSAAPLAPHHPESLEGMDQQLKAMEDMIVDEAVKFTGANQGIADPDKIKKVKDQVLERLAAAYSLEKMRQALVEFRSSMKGQGQANNKRSVQN